MTNLKLTNTFRENGGQWTTDIVSEYHKKLLLEYQQEEPAAGWKFQTRGNNTQWHDVIETS